MSQAITTEPIVAGMGISSDASAVVAPTRSRVATGGTRYETQPTWNGGTRNFESGETTRLNEAHWQNARDVSVNEWLAEQLPIIRSRSGLETRNNGMLLGIVNTHADDIVGPEGPTLQVISDNDAYNTAVEEVWNDWFAAPTPRANVSGVMMLKSWVRSLWKGGEFLAQLVTMPDAEGPVSLRLLPTPPRSLFTPADVGDRPDVFMGIRFDQFKRPASYYINTLETYEQVPADLIIHEYLIEEEDQARGIPWLNTALQPAGDLRDYDNQVQDAARQIADQTGIMYSDHPDIVPWTTPEETTIERRTWKMAPPGWKPFIYTAAQPPVQYPDYRAERTREFGRPVGMPLLMARLDSSKHNYSSARLDTQTYGRAVAGIQYWISGTPRNAGTLNRLVDEVVKEARFSVQALRTPPERVRYQWTWAVRPHVDPFKEAMAEKTSLANLTLTVTDALAARGSSIEVHLEKLIRERDLLIKAGLPVPEHLQDAADALEVVKAGDDAKEAGPDKKGTEEIPAKVAAAEGGTEQDIETAPDMTLNGAQINAASEIVTQVAEGVIPRDAGIGQLEVLLNLSAEQAERVMGMVGKGFKPSAPPTQQSQQGATADAK